MKYLTSYTNTHKCTHTHSEPNIYKKQNFKTYSTEFRIICLLYWNSLEFFLKDSKYTNIKENIIHAPTLKFNIFINQKSSYNTNMHYEEIPMKLKYINFPT